MADNENTGQATGGEVKVKRTRKTEKNIIASVRIPEKRMEPYNVARGDSELATYLRVAGRAYADIIRELDQDEPSLEKIKAIRRKADYVLTAADW